MKGNVSQVKQNAQVYQRSPNEWLPEAKSFGSAKTFRNRIFPLLQKVADTLLKLYAQYCKEKDKNERLERRKDSLERQVNRLSNRCEEYEQENQMLRSQDRNFNRVRSVLGDRVVEGALETAMMRERRIALEQQHKPKRHYDRDTR